MVVVVVVVAVCCSCGGPSSAAAAQEPGKKVPEGYYETTSSTPPPSYRDHHHHHHGTRTCRGGGGDGGVVLVHTAVVMVVMVVVPILLLKKKHQFFFLRGDASKNQVFNQVTKGFGYLGMGPIFFAPHQGANGNSIITGQSKTHWGVRREFGWVVVCFLPDIYQSLPTEKKNPVGKSGPFLTFFFLGWVGLGLGRSSVSE